VGGRMSTRVASWLAWSTCALSLVLIALSLLLLVLTWSRAGVYVFDYWVENAMVAVVSSTVGSVVASRRPDHPIGWLFCAIGLIGAARPLAAEYATYALLVEPGGLSGGAVLAWIAAWMWVPHLGLMMFLGLLFPDGRLPSARWRPFAWFVVIAVFVGTIATAFSPGPLAGLAPIENPFGIEGLKRLVGEARALVWALVVVVAISMLVRLHRARGIERQQLKWFAYAAAVATIGGLLTYVGSPEATGVLSIRWAGLILTVIGLSGIPIAMGIAILKYRLYGIDPLINRTLVYGSLTATLVGLYFGGIVVLQRMFVILTGHESTLAVVASTLLIAALFNPLRRRIQSFIDRSFYRRKYDARRTLEAFSVKLRDETDLEALNSDLVGVVRETMAPAHVTLWLRPNSPSKGSEGQE
jgi:hypothetical protein